MDDAPTLDWKRLADRLALLALIGWIGYAALGTNVFGERPWPDGVVDYHLLYDYSKQVVAQKTFPPKYAYPPSAVILQYGSAQFPFAVSAALYLALTIVSALASWWILLRLLGLDHQPGKTALGLLALVPVSSCFSWDLKSQNCNVLFLVTVLLGIQCLVKNRPRRAGFWLALSVSLKLFPVLLLPYLLASGRCRACAWMLGFLGVFWIVLPLYVFGPSGTIEVYDHWGDQMRDVSRSQVDFNHPILISLQNSAHWWAAHHGPSRELSVNMIRSAWLGLGFAGLLAFWRRRNVQDNVFGILADVSLLLLGPIALSPYLEPYHPVPMAIPAMLLLAAVGDSQQRAGIRSLALAFFVAACAMRLVPSPWAMRGLMMNLCLLLMVGGVMAVAWLRRPSSATLLAQRCLQLSAKSPYEAPLPDPAAA
jgi:hypothetical protein